MTFVQEAFCSALYILLLRNMESSSGVRETFGKAVKQAVTFLETLTAIKSATDKNEAMVTPIPMLAAEREQMEVEDCFKYLFLTTSSPPRAGSDSLSIEYQNNRREKSAKNKSHRRMMSSLTLQKAT